jgi:uncharacterized protein YndB with AHSA1/START domain
MRRAFMALLFIAVPLHADSARRIEKEVVVSAPRATVWNAWTTTDGAKTFFAPDAKIELVPGGAYEIYFGPTQPAGLKGGETNRVIAFEPQTMLLFSWNAPPKFGPLRKEHTYVLIRFDDAPGGGTRVRLTHFGWREADEWNAVYDYFDKAWGPVMGNFAKRYDAVNTPAR